MACLDNIIEINKSDCIGNSRETINNNFITIKDKICSLDIEQKVTEDKTKFDVPLYGIILYYGDITPGGTDFEPNGRGRQSKNLQAYALCNGANGTPDMRDRFVVCAGQNYPHKSYGPGPVPTYTNDTLSLEFSSVRLTVSEMPIHDHDYTEPNQGKGHRHTYVYPKGSGDTSGGVWPFSGSSSDYEQGHNDENYLTSYEKTDIDISNEGGSLKHENRPPYIALGYIMRVSTT